MKRFTILLAALVMLAFSAGAERWDWLDIGYNSSAKTFGAKEISEDQLRIVTTKENEEMWVFDFPSYSVVFTFNEKEELVDAFVAAVDDSEAMDFFLACVCVMTYLGDVSYSSWGMLLNQYAEARKGNELIPGTLGSDSYQIRPGTNGYKYMFLYMNNDLSYK